MPQNETFRSYVLTREQQENFDPVRFVRDLKAAGFNFDRESCPYKLTEPWDRVDAGNGAVCYRQWKA